MAGSTAVAVAWTFEPFQPHAFRNLISGAEIREIVISDGPFHYERTLTGSSSLRTLPSGKKEMGATLTAA